MKKSIFSNITIEKLIDWHLDPNFILIDTRPISAYNGWRLDGQSWGGHIEGSISFPISWTKQIERESLVNLLASKGIKPHKDVLIYGFGESDAREMALVLKKLDFPSVNACIEDTSSWSNKDNLPASRLSRYEKLVHPKWVDKLINGHKPETFSGESYRIFEVNNGGEELYLAGHIPGAIHFDLNIVEKEPFWNRIADEELVKVLPSLGITKTSMVVLYGRDPTPAFRLASILLYAGVEDVRVLDGGLGAWSRAGYQIEQGPRKVKPAKSFGGTLPMHPEIIIDFEDIRSRRKAYGKTIVDIRSREEFLGQTSGYDFIRSKGRIATAVWGHAGSDPFHMEHFRNVDNTLRDYNEISRFWAEEGITPDKEVVFYCGTGWRASEAFFAAYLMGWPKIAVYDGGWFEWSRNPDNPIEHGSP